MPYRASRDTGNKEKVMPQNDDCKTCRYPKGKMKIKKESGMKTSVVWRSLVVSGLLLVQVAPARQDRVAPAITAATRTPVIVELFTSEGCSSCPPADDLLARIEKVQPVPGVQIITLGEHVDYWNRLGWADPYSSARFSERQRQYAQAFKADSVYTPQMVVDGRAEFVGSNISKAHEAITDAARAPKAKVQIARSPSSSGEKSGAIGLQVRVERLPALSAGDTADVLLAIVEDNLHSDVPRGENAGRRLNHSAVARQLRAIARLNSDRSDPFFAETVVTLATHWKDENLRVIAFVQERGSRRILGAGVARLTAL